VRLPARDQLVFVAGLGGLAIAGIVEWPVAAAAGAGHILVQSRNSKTLRDVGDALDEGERLACVRKGGRPGPAGPGARWLIGGRDLC
jgi:hypothetical protein